MAARIGCFMDENVIEVKNTDKEGSFSSINVKSFVLVMALLLSILAISGALSYFIPQGMYLRDESGAIIPDTYMQGTVKGIAFWRVLTAPIRVFASEDALTIIFISLFLLVMSGVFNLLDKTNGIRIFIGKTVKKFAGKNNVVVCVATLIFMAFGSFNAITLRNKRLIALRCIFVRLY